MHEEEEENKDLSLHEKMNRMMAVQAKMVVAQERMSMFIEGDEKLKIKGAGERLNHLEKYKVYFIVAMAVAVATGSISGGIKAFEFIAKYL